jgi:hypothetical protein
VDNTEKNQRMMKSTNFESTFKRNTGGVGGGGDRTASESMGKGGTTTNSMFKTKNSQALIPLNLKNKDKST